MKLSSIILENKSLKDYPTKKVDIVKTLSCLSYRKSKDLPQEKFLKLEDYYFNSNKVEETIADIDSYISLEQYGSIYLPNISWPGRKCLLKLRNKSNAIVSDFSIGINSKIISGNASKEKTFAFSEIKKNKKDFVKGTNPTLEVFWDYIKVNETRQGSSNEKVLEYCHDLLNLPGKLQSLPNNGVKAFYLIDNKVKSGFSKKPKGSTESFDFIFEYNNISYYIMHKYQAGKGGGQGQIFGKVLDNIKNFNDNSNIKIVFIAEGDHALCVNEHKYVYNNFKEFYKHVYAESNL